MTRITRMAFAIIAIIAASVVTLALPAAPASARVVQIEQPDDERVRHNPLVYVERVSRRWYYGELADGSTWRGTYCPVEDDRNCFWNVPVDARQGMTFVNIHGHYHYYRAPADVRVTMTSRCRHGGNVYVFRLRNVGDVTRTVRATLTSYATTPPISKWRTFRVTPGDTKVNDYRMTGNEHKRVTYRSQGRVIMRADMTRGACGR